jgi:hypothetical protein
MKHEASWNGARRVMVAGAIAWGALADSVPASAICRVVEPVEAQGVAFDLRTAALFALSPNQVVDYECVAVPDAMSFSDAGAASTDAGATSSDAGATRTDAAAPSLDGGSDAGDPLLDAGDPLLDAGDPLLDAGNVDAGALDDAAVLATDGGTFLADDAGALDADAGALDAGALEPPPRCPAGTVLEPVHDTLVSVVVQPSVLASGGSAGLVMPVPARPDIAIGSSELFEAAAALIVPRVHETVNVRETADLGYQCDDPHYSSDSSGCGAWDDGDDWDPPGMDGGSYYRPGTEDRDASVTDYGDAGIVRHETFLSGDMYDVTVLSASTPEALALWLDEHAFAHDEDDDAAFGAYVRDGAWFVAVHVHPPDMGGREVALEPLVVTWRGDTIPITHRLQYDPNGGMLFTDAFVIAPTRMAAADGSAFTEYAAPATFAGTPLRFGLDYGWLTRLSFTRFVAEERADSELVARSLAEVRPIEEHTVNVSIPAPCCRGSTSQERRTFTYERSYVGEGGPIPSEWFRAPPLDDEACPPARRSGCCARCTAGSPTRWDELAVAWAPLALALFLVVRNRPRR